MSKCASVVVLVAVLSSLALAPARANDLEKVLGALAVGYLAYQALDGARCEVPAPPSYAPPSGGYHGGEPRYWYDEGYSDAFRERAIWAPPVAHREGEEACYWYREGHRDGLRDAEAFRRCGPPRAGVVVWGPGPDRRDDRWGRAGGHGGPPPKGRPGGYMPPPPGWQGGHAGPGPRGGRPEGYGPPPPNSRNHGHGGPPQYQRPGGHERDQRGPREPVRRER